MNRRKFGGLGAAFLLFLTLAGCGGKETGTVVTTEQATGDATSVRYSTRDKWVISGDMYKPTGVPRGGVLLLHQRGGSGDDWHALCIALQQAGFTALAIDQRGTGRSTQGPGQSGEYAPWDTSPDIEGGLYVLKEFGPTAIVGASYGANNALIYGTANPSQMKSLVLFSPGKDYHGLDAVSAARKYTGALLIFHQKGDKIAGDGPAEIDKASASKEHLLQISDGTGHGTALLNTGVTQQTIDFLAKTMK